MDQNKLAHLSADCPRCGQAKSTFDVVGQNSLGASDPPLLFEVLTRCRACKLGSIALLIKNGAMQSPMQYAGRFLDNFKLVHWVIVLPDARRCPLHVPAPLACVFGEAAKCLSIGAHDAAGTMFRKLLDLATRAQIQPPESAGAKPSAPSWKVYKDLRLRLDWMFENHLLNPALKELSACIHQDGNDAAHDLTGIGQAEAKDLADFSEVVLETLYTLPGQIAENQRRRDQRRSG